MNKNFPFYDWVPKPLGIIFMIFLFIPIMTVGGVYTANSSEMVGGLGIMSEHISFVGFVTSVGMAAFSPFFYTFVCLRRQKLMMIWGFLVLFILSWICAVTDSVFILALCSLIMGFVRQSLLMCNLFTLIKYGFGIEATINITPGKEPKDEAGWDALDKEKTASQPTIYLFFMILGQIGTWTTAWFAYNYEWQDVYYVMMAVLGFSIIIILFTMPDHGYGYRGSRLPLNFSKFGNVTVFCLMCCSFIFIMVYGKTFDWYSHPYIRWATFICVVSSALFVWLEKTRRSPYFLLEAFKCRSIQGAILLFISLMFLNTSAMLVNVFTSVGMKLDNLQVAGLGNWVLLGYFFGFVIAVIWSRKSFHFKYLFSLGYIILGCSAAYMYFEVQTQGLLEHMKWPVIIRATGMMMIYSVSAVYANQRMPFRLLSTWVCIMLTVRMVIGPGAGSAFYTNMLQDRQQHYITRLAHDYDRTHPETAATYDRTIMGMQMQGKSKAEAEAMAAMSAKGTVQVQATLLAVKDLAGWTIYGCLACALIVVAVPWPKKRLEKIRI